MILLKQKEVKPEDKTYVFIMSTMRAGSTLLNSLLSTAKDVSNLAEVNFNKIQDIKEASNYSSKNIIVFKKPSWYTELEYYPKIPNFPKEKIIILTRDVYPVIKSLYKMHKIADPLPDEIWRDKKKIVEDYWCKTYENILQKFPLKNKDTYLIRYEDLLQNPKIETKKLFHFIGSRRKRGTNKYRNLKNREWQWGKGDAGEYIKKLKVIKKDVIYDDIELLNIIKSSDRAQRLRKKFGYYSEIPL
jgi:hypothetical protein